MKTEDKKPSIVTDEHLEYLDDLRESGSVNMMGAGINLCRQFGVSKNDARIVLMYWMKNI